MKTKFTKTETKNYLTQKLATAVIKKFTNSDFSGTKDDIRINYYASTNYISIKRKIGDNTIFLDFKISSSLSLEKGYVSDVMEGIMSNGKSKALSTESKILYTYSTNADSVQLDNAIEEAISIIDEYIKTAKEYNFEM